jgi:mediator of RNA polymerase II transcription subunit 20
LSFADPSLPVDCARDILGVSFSENPNKYFFILRTEHMVVEADSNIQEIMEKLQTYRNRLTLVFEVMLLLSFCAFVKASETSLN